jgi:hypothetical protein
MAVSKALRTGGLALAAAATLFAVWQVNERDRRIPGGEAAGARDGSLRADTARGRSGSDSDNDNWLSLLRRVPIAAQTAGELFSSSTWAPPPVAPPPAVKPVETPPPFPFVYLGKSVLDGATRLYLTKAVAPNAPPGPVFMVASGETLDGTYRIDSVTDDTLEVTYLPMNKPQTLTFASLVANAGPPQAGTPVSAAPSSYYPSTQAYVPQPLAAAAPASTSTPAGGMAFGGGAVAGSASTGTASPSAATSAFSNTGSTGGGAGIGASASGGTSAVNPGAAPAGALGGQPVGSGILGVAVNNNSPIGFNGAVSPGSMPTGSGAPSGPGPVTR